MGIIGVVAALTLPNLNSSTGEKEKVAKVKKLYSNIQDAYNRATAVYGPFDEIKSSDYDDYEKKASERITEFMKISKNCGADYNGGCIPGNKLGKTYNGSTFVGEDGYTYILADGTSINIYTVGPASIIVYVDIDGPLKGPYVQGRDLFSFGVDSDSGYENGMQPFDSYTEWVINHGNMDYLKTTSGIGSKCPDGKTVLNGTTNTTCK